METGDFVNGIMNLKSGRIYSSEGFCLNCHVCGTTYSPLLVDIIPMDLYDYLHGYYSRYCLIYVKNLTGLCRCVMEQMNNGWLITSLTDPIEGRIDPLQRLVISKEDNKKWRKVTYKELLEDAKKQVDIVNSLYTKRENNVQI